jgi:hypothetical protein
MPKISAQSPSTANTAAAVFATLGAWALVFGIG